VQRCVAALPGLRRSQGRLPPPCAHVVEVARRVDLIADGAREFLDERVGLHRMIWFLREIALVVLHLANVVCTPEHPPRKPRFS
jgi:hypothetical protein